MDDAETLIRRELMPLLPRLRRFARGLTGNSADADDLVQMAIERALRGVGTWKPGSRVDSWVFRILRNAWIDETRSRRVRNPVPADADGIDIADPQGQAAVESALTRLAIDRAMLQLPPEQREAVTVVLVEGLSYREAADLLEVPIGTLTSRLARGRMALEQWLRPDSLGQTGQAS